MSRTTLLEPQRAEPTPSAPTPALPRGRDLLRWVLQRPWRSVVACGMVGFALAAIVTLAGGFPPPRIHDEFSYLLAGDTYAHGHVAYPTHPMWRHFETFHELQVPAYASKYPPAQGLVLALGQVLTGAPIVGVWISCALMVAAFNWMLRAWTSARWAWWGAIAAGLWITGQHAREAYWATSFWGGAVAAMAAALVLGGVRRLARRASVPDSTAIGVGIAVLANSRPLEAIFFVVVPAAVVAWLFSRLLLAKQMRLAAITVVPMLLVCGATAVGMAIMNYRVTGSAWRPPYIAYEQQYGSSPNLIGQDSPHAPAYRVAVMDQFYTRGTGLTRPPRDLKEFAKGLAARSTVLADFYAPWFIIPLVFVLPWVTRGFWMTVAVACAALTGVALALTLFVSQAHYAAPAAAAWCILLTHAARHAAQLRWRHVMTGRGVVRIIFACLVLSFLGQAAVSRLRLPRARETAWPWRRQEIERSLARNGKHLVLVEYGPRHLPDKEWVFNQADIDAAPVVWARSLGEAADAGLRRYFAGRTMWRLRIDDDYGSFTLVALGPAATGASRSATNPPLP
jgi:hypothetical protein